MRAISSKGLILAVQGARPSSTPLLRRVLVQNGVGEMCVEGSWL